MKRKDIAHDHCLISGIVFSPNKSIVFSFFGLEFVNTISVIPAFSKLDNSLIHSSSFMITNIPFFN
jgi:hypothetical protein